MTASQEDTPSLDRLVAADFEPLVESKFHLRSDGLDLVLLEVSSMSEKPGSGETRQAFSVLFQGPLEPLLDQGIRALSHDQLGELEIFLVPVSQTDQGIRYEAVFT